jgi:hypothetical protein
MFRCSGIVLLILVTVLIAFWPKPRMREAAPRSVESSNLRQLGQASLIYASQHGDKLPVGDNIWDYAGALARDGGLNDATIWSIGVDPAAADTAAYLSTVLTSDRHGLDSAFRKLAPSWAVPLGQLNTDMPATMPIGWTRGLRPDGTWAPHSPFGEIGGHVVFLGGNVAFYRNVKDELVRFDGKGKTSNILEALPPGTRIGEYVPSETEAQSWAKMRRWMDTKNAIRPVILPALWLLALVTLVVQVVRKRWSIWILAGFLAVSLGCIVRWLGYVRE